MNPHEIIFTKENGELFVQMRTVKEVRQGHRLPFGLPRGSSEEGGDRRLVKIHFSII